ncbi:MAG: exodeoxyribonuclease I [Rubrivivax sp.]
MADFSFLWHDYETFGAVPRRDGPAQFAAIRTDAELRELGEPVMSFCRPALDRLPDPESCLITGLLPQQCQKAGLPEHAFAREVARHLGQPGTVGVGYNSIRFDDEVTRFLMWRNLRDHYAREWREGCGRWDLLDVVRCAWALRPEGLVWPTHPDGRPSFRLEHLSQANGLAHEAAHDALSDVRATLGLARLVRERKRRLWDFCLRLRSKDAVRQELVMGRPVLHVSGRYSTERGCLAIVYPLASHPVNRNEVIVWDLAHDPQQLMALDAATIRERVFAREGTLPEGVARLPLRTIHLNRSPVVIGNLGTLGPDRAERFGLDVATAERHAVAAARIVGEMAGVWPEVYTTAKAPAPDVDEDLYGGFVDDTDRAVLARLVELAPEELARQRPHLRDARLEELLFRYRARNFPETLQPDERARWEAHRQARLHEGAGGCTTLAQFLERIDALSEEADERGQDILSGLVDWAEAIAPDRA